MSDWNKNKRCDCQPNLGERCPGCTASDKPEWEERLWEYSGDFVSREAFEMHKSFIRQNFISRTTLKEVVEKLEMKGYPVDKMALAVKSAYNTALSDLLRELGIE